MNLPKTQKQFEKWCAEKRVFYPFKNINCRVELSDNPYHFAHSIELNNNNVASHSKKLSGFKNTLNWCAKNIILG